MNWKSLKNGKCPKCDSLIYDENIHIVRCRNSACDFVIRQTRLKEILASKPMPQDNLSELNNLSYKEMPEGFLEEEVNLGDW